jgi:hypothetical protein
MLLVDDRCERPRVVRGPAEHGTSCFAAGQLNWCKCCVALRRRRTLARAKDAARVPGTVAGASTNESKYAGTDPTTLSVLVGHRGRSTRRESHHRSRHNRIARKIADVEPESTSSIWETQIATCWKICFSCRGSGSEPIAMFVDCVAGRSEQRKKGASSRLHSHVRAVT